MRAAAHRAAGPREPLPAESRAAPIPLGLDPQALGRQGGALDAIIVRDLPSTATLSAGTYDPAIDAWVVLPRQLAALTVLPSESTRQDFTLSRPRGLPAAGSRAGPRLLAQVPVRVG